MDIEKLSEEEKNKLLEQLLEKVNNNEEATTPPRGANIKKIGGADSGPKKVDPTQATSSSKTTQVNVPINQRKHLNKFEELEKKFFKPDEDKLVKEDREYWSKRQPTPRKDPPDMFEINCKKCSRTFYVYNHQLRSDPDLGVHYICNKCSTTGGG